jgi:hypothetical protein
MILTLRVDVGHGGGGSRLRFWLKRLQSRTSKKGKREAAAPEQGEERGWGFQGIRGAEDKERRGLTHSAWVGKKVEEGVTLTRSACLPEEDDREGSIEGGLRCDFGLEEGGCWGVDGRRGCSPNPNLR